MKVNAIKCPYCSEIIYSRCTHDFHWCHCGKTAIDGGFDYVKITSDKLEEIKVFSTDVTATKKDLYDDWNNSTDKFGWGE